MTRLPQIAGLAVAAAALAACGSTTTASDPGTSPTAPASSSMSDPSSPSDSDSAAPKDITLDTPAEGDAVSGSFTAAGKANSPEANVPWQITDASGAKVLDGFATAAGWLDRLYPYSTTVDVSSLDPGTYTFTVSTDNEADAGEGPGPESISRTITVGTVG
jgi:hypothetical protein